jgi:ferredoxin-NADP reductase
VAGTAVLGRLTQPRRLAWRAAHVADVVVETPRVRTLVLDVDGWDGHRPGQHLDIRLTSEDGYQAQRSYSIASAPSAGRLELTVERVEDGEVSPYLVDELRAGDVFEVRGPVGGYFVWEPSLGGPLLLVAGGSGVAPLASMLRVRPVDVETRLVYSARTLEDVIYRDELERLGDDLVLTLTRETLASSFARSGRVNADLLREVGFAPDERPHVYVCGPTGFVEAVASVLVELGHEPERIRTERFGPSGT